MNITIVGLGLIGGSLAKACTEYTEHHVTGIDTNSEVTAKALQTGAIHAIGSADSLKQTDILYLCLYPQDAVRFVENHLEYLKPGCIVTDTSGIKTMLCKELTALAKVNNFTFLGSHPMAGKEKNGFDASEACLFNGASYIIVPCDAPPLAVDTIKQLAMELGFGSIRVTTAAEHDKMIAFTSQLPHVLACAYVMSPLCPNHKGFSAGSYRDVSRVARINEVLWTELFLENRQPLVDELDTLLLNITNLRNAVANSDKQELERLLKQGREIKEALGE